MPQDTQQIYFPKLNTKTIKSPLKQFSKIAAELGELAENINLLLGIEDQRKEVPEDIAERTIEECFDVAQSAVSMAFSVYEIFGRDGLIEKMQERHIQKMRERGYLDDGN